MTKKQICIVIVVLLGLVISFFLVKPFLFPDYIVDNNTYEKLYKEEKEKADKLEAARITERDSLIELLAYNDKKFNNLVDKISHLDNKIGEIFSKEVYKPSTTEESAEYFNTRYKTKENVVTENNVNLGLNTASNVIVDLQTGDKAIQILPLKDSIILYKSDQIELLTTDKESINKQLFLTEQSLDNYKELNKSAEVQIDVLSSYNKTLRQRNTFNKILIPISLLLGGTLGFMIAK